jgi:hypothetical protein
MTRGLAITSFLILTSCAAAPHPPELAVFHHPNGTRAAEGAVLERENDVYSAEALEQRTAFPWTVRQRTGTWHYWHPNGQLRAIVQYGTGQFTDCCVAGLCTRPYERPVGRVELFDESGKPLLNRRPGSRTYRIETNCDGGAAIFAPRVTLPADIRPQLPPGA